MTPAHEGSQRSVRTLTSYLLLSLDGVAEEPGDWMFEADGDVFANLARVIGTQSDVLLGRATYDYWAGYWPGSDVQPFADFINGTTKHVVTSTPLAAAWSGSQVVAGPLFEHVTELKRGDGGDIGLHGSIRLTQALLAAGLVDRLELVVVPTIAGSGRRLFDGGELRRLSLARAQRSPSGCAFLTYDVPFSQP